MWWIALVGVVVLAVVSWALVVSKVEQPKYLVVENDRSIEIRDYPAMIIAEADVRGARDKAIGDGFRIIAEYIFGNNLSSKKVAMTAPVTQQASEKIVMTAPVTQQGGGDSWKVGFIMPANYTMETLPKPKNPAVQLKEVASRRFAVIRFSGLAGEESLKRQTDLLAKFVSKRKLTAVSAPTYAFYNPPWTLPFLRRNEVMIEVYR